MSTTRENPAQHRISVVDNDPLRARREARELLNDIVGTDPGAFLDVPRPHALGSADKGGVSADAIGLVISAGSLVAAAAQVWLARVPQRTIVVTRQDGAVLRITGKEAREDDGRIERFLAGTDSGATSEGNGGPTAA
ncbi:hypothetical protein [Streptomyces sp. NBC_01794]|uniref:hypothetical protein n=1 Tax=Streptomyces sp. NBC_01794 TaxID=2975942 RepID=UPI0030927391|nr:hypothetical protein OIE54_10930 [Streptomyces sp. NBC_01794]